MLQHGESITLRKGYKRGGAEDAQTRSKSLSLQYNYKFVFRSIREGVHSGISPGGIAIGIISIQKKKREMYQTRLGFS